MRSRIGTPAHLCLQVAIFLCATLPTISNAEIRLRDAAQAWGVADDGLASGGAFGDFDADGRPDLIVTRMARGEQVLLYRNIGRQFVDASDRWTPPENSMGSLFADVDDDGDDDLYIIVHRAPNQIHLNEGGRFVSTPAPEFRESQNATGAILADFDEDGVGDAYITHRFDYGNQLISDFGGSSLRDLSLLVSPLRSGQESFGATPIDIDGDGRLEIFVTSWGFVNLLHRNLGAGRFATIQGGAGTASRAASILGLPADYDNDGDTDLYVLNGHESPNELYRNDGGTFTDVARQAGVAGEESSGGGAWVDLDNDGYLDLLIANLGQTPRVYRGRGTYFVDASIEAFGDTTSGARVHSGVAVADIDLDGDVDAFLASPGETDMLLINDSDQGTWLVLDMDRNPTYAGAQIQILGSDGRQQTRTYAPASLLGSTHEGALHVGLGEATSAEVQVRWPDGHVDDFGTVQATTKVQLRPRGSGSDLAILEVLSPELQQRWQQIEPRVRLRNTGRTTAASAVMFEVTGPRGHVETSLRESGSLAPGEEREITFDAWKPGLPGNHNFHVRLLTPDDHAGNDVWSQQQILHDFTDEAGALGIDNPGHSWAGAFADIDNDGDLDLYVSNGGTYGNDVNAMYRNEGETFTNVTAAAAVVDNGNGASVAFADFDRDGDQDLFLSRGGFSRRGQSDRLLSNDGAGVFTDISAEAGVDQASSSRAVVLGDYNNDGFVDLFVSHRRGRDNTLYRNVAGVFENVSQQRDIVDSTSAWGGPGVFSDFDNDGDLDLYAGFLGEYDLIYAEVGMAQYAVSLAGDAGDLAGIAAGDYDLDGDLDIHVTNSSGRSALRRNDMSTTLFTDVGSETGTENLAVGTGCAFIDFDNDGDLDLLVSNLTSINRMYVNEGGAYADHAIAFGLDDDRESRGVMVGDIDNDGDEDVYVLNQDGANGLYRNGDIDHGFLRVQVHGVESNPDGIGARLYAHLGDRVLMREVNGTAGNSYSDRSVTFGLGQRSKVDSLIVSWPSGIRQHVGPLAANSLLQIEEGLTPTAVADDSQVTPAVSWLATAYPNPFNPETVLRFSVGVEGPVVIDLYNALGQRVRRLLEDDVMAGEHAVHWDGADEDGHPMATGVYISTLSVAGHVKARTRMTLLR
jgi:enediyne biosynthesis protein E4